MGQASWLAQLLPEPSPVRPYVHPSQYHVVPDVRHYSDGMHKLYQPNLVTLVIAVVTLGLYISVPHVLIGLFAASFFSRAALLSLVLLMLSLLMPAQPLRVPQVLSSYVFLCWRRYFKFSYLFETNLNCYQDYIIAQFPHGAFPIGALIGGTFMATEYPEYPCYALAANAAFLVPLWRHVHAWLGTEACTKTNFHNLLARGVKGPLPPARHRHHHNNHNQQQLHSTGIPPAAGGGSEAVKATANNSSNNSAKQQAGSRGSKPTCSTPFNSCAVALAAAADGVAAVPHAAAAAASGIPYAPDRLAPFASAAVLTGALTGVPSEAAAGSAAGAGVSGASGLTRRTYSAPLGRRLSQAFSMPSGIFRPGHTLSDSESSESECDTPQAAEGQGAGEISWEVCCTCGSGLACRDPQFCRALRSAGGSSSRRSSSDGSNSSSGMGGSGSRMSDSSNGSDASLCSCCGALAVVAHVQPLPSADSSGTITGRKQRQSYSHSQLLMTIPSGELQGPFAAAAAAVGTAAVELDSSAPLLQHQHQHQQHQHQQQGLKKQQLVLSSSQPQPQQQQSFADAASSQQLLRHDQTKPSNWVVDPLTGARKLGVSVGLMVGGIAEMFMIRADHERIKLKERKGFIRIALEHGVDILPVYIFGVNQALAFGPPWLQRVSRKMRASLGVIYGLWGLPIPRRVPIFMVTGHPLAVGPPMRKDHPDFAARVDALHAQFCAEMERIYYTHRGKYGHGFENRPLVIC